MIRLMQRTIHLGERILREGKSYPRRKEEYGWKVANAAFIDGIIPPGKSRMYISVISEYVDRNLGDLTELYRINRQPDCSMQFGEKKTSRGKIPVWCCWWQGVENMPELVRMCHDRLKQVLPSEVAELHVITLENYKDYVDVPEHIVEKFEKGIITMTTMSDVLRFRLLEQYGGYWLDATVFFSGNIPEEYFSGQFYCQKMVGNIELARREACGSNWCGFSMAGPRGSIIFQFMNDAFNKWWEMHDSIIDYVLIDYLLLSGFRHVPQIREIIQSVPDNNEDIFEMYKMLNEPYSAELMESLTKRNVMHKLTYKMDLKKKTNEGRITLYGYLYSLVYGTDEGC